MSESLSAPTHLAPPVGAAQLSRADAGARRMRRWGAVAGIAGPLLLVAYFATPALIGWPSASATPERLIAFATGHAQLFYAGGWLQVTGALLSVLFFLVLLQLSGARAGLAGAMTLTGAAVLLAVVTIEAVLLEAVPIAASAHDAATVATSFALSNDGVFARIFPLAPASLLFAGIGLALLSAPLLPRVFPRGALLLAGLFVLAGIGAIFGTPGLIFATVLSVLQALWIAAAAVALSRTAPATAVPTPRPPETSH
jgi:hypothetical protein